MKKNRIPPMTRPTPQPKTVVLSLTKEQVSGIKVRYAAREQAMTNLGNYLQGIVEGKGYTQFETEGIDDEKLTLTIKVPA